MANSRIGNRYLPDLKHVRIFGYATTLIVHALNSVYMINVYQGEWQQEPEVAFFWKIHMRMLTIWNVIGQIIYAILGLSCEILSFSNEGKDSSLLKNLRIVRDRLFSAIVFPISLGISIIFWPLYSYDPYLLIPAPAHKIMPSISNHIIHTLIVPIVLWEAVCRPRRVPASHLLNLVGLNIYNVAFVITLFETQYETGRFPYPMLNMIDGTPYLYIFLIICFIINNFSYKFQWFITGLIYGKEEKYMKKVR